MKETKQQRTNRQKGLKQKLKSSPGSPSPMGVHRAERGLNFALFSSTASAVTLNLFFTHTSDPFARFSLDPTTHKTGAIWHIYIEGLQEEEIEYTYQVNSQGAEAQDVIDPYSQGLSSPSQWGSTRDNYHPRAKITHPLPFDWQGIEAPGIPLQDLIIYEMHVRAFSIHPSSQVQSPGTFGGLTEKIPHLKELGINAIELMPIFEFNECENKRINPISHQLLYNVWGYSTVNFFSLMNRYGTPHELKTLVRELHRNHIEIYLDVVYNHTAELGAKGPLLSFKGIDPRTYYMLSPEGKYLDFSGTGNTFNVNHPVVAQLVVDSLRYFVQEFHIDGFRFDLASCLTRGPDGTPSNHPFVIQMITEDPLLKNVKLIAEAWDAAGIYQVGHFPGGSRWLEWNGKYRDVTRRFLKGGSGLSGGFAQALSGSQDLYGNGRSPCHSINFITCHDGFSLKDLVSYNSKNNIQNGEQNRDGNAQNDSWNCGHEGPTDNPQILSLRERQMRNFHLALMVSVGSPMLLMGDEYGHTRQGNNNTYCQDNELNWFLWDALTQHPSWARFYKCMIQLRRFHPLLRRTTFLQEADVQWHGLKPLLPCWKSQYNFIAYTLRCPNNVRSLYIAFNATQDSLELEFPAPSPGENWYRIVDTALPSPHDFEDIPVGPLDTTYRLAPYSSFIATQSNAPLMHHHDDNTSSSFFK